MSKYLLLPLLFQVTFAFNGGCVWKDSSVANDYLPCNSTSAGGTCCLKGETCLESGLCQSAARNVYRGACHKVWAKDTCITICEEISVNWANFQSCPSDDYWCGLSTDTPCSTTNGTILSFPPGKPIKVLALTLEDSTSSSSSSSTPPTPSPSTSTQLESETATPTSSTSPPASTENSSSGLSTGAIVGIAVGLGLLALLAIVGGIFWIRRNRKQKDAAQKEYPSEMDAATGPEGMVMVGGGVGGFDEHYKEHQPYTDEQPAAFSELDTRVKRVPELGGGDRRVVAELDSTTRY